MLSMTGFGSGSCERDRWRASVFIKSWNGKGLDIFIKSNQNLMAIELTIRKMVKDLVKRGTVSVHVEVEKRELAEPVSYEKLIANLNFFKLIKEELSLNVSDDTLFSLAVRFAESREEEVDNSLEEAIVCALNDALRELLRRRTEEGQELRRDMEERISRIEKLLEVIVREKDVVYENAKRRVLERAKEVGLSEVNATVLNEISLILSKMDVEEEITRFRAHLVRSRELLASGDEVGRKLEFILQEMHREITTLSNKLPDLSPVAVEIRTEIDRLRQQVANVE
ncbi:MAG: YicC family protein [Acidobacteria bacterium]|jgi:uncharacterized protein (TIGR00255 family)|nr:MAG: YicC family protein [Acidobacteriota bacterium]